MEDAISPSRNHPPIKGYHAKDVLEYICPEINTSYLKSGLPTPKVHEQIMKIDEQNVSYKSFLSFLDCFGQKYTGNSTEKPYLRELAVILKCVVIDS